MPIVFRGPFGDVSLVDAFRATADERARSMGRTEAAFWLRTMDDRLLDAIPTGGFELLGVTRPSFSRRPELRALLRRRLAEALASGSVLALRRERRVHVLPYEQDDDEVLGPDDSEKLRVDFFFDYQDGTAVRDLAYVLEDSGGSKTKGKLPKDGSVARDSASGTYTVSLKDIDILQWQPARIKRTEEAKVVARVTGLDDGAQGTVRIYRLYDEDEKAALATLSASVTGGTLEAAWKPDAKTTSGPPDADGLSYFVAELSFENGVVWRKTLPLAVELPAIVGVAWSAPDADDGEDVSLVVTTTGFADGAQVAVTLVAHDLLGDDKPLGDAPSATVAGGTASFSFKAGDGLLQALAYDVIAKVTVEGNGAKAAACSPILRVHPAAPPADDDAQGSMDAAA